MVCDWEKFLEVKNWSVKEIHVALHTFSHTFFLDVGNNLILLTD